MPAPKKTDPDKADEQAAPVTPAKLSAARLRDARFIGGAWVDADGAPFTPAETRRIHQARDAEAMAARLKQLGGES